jgi:hypothetical protein
MEKYKNCDGAPRIEKVATLKMGQESQQNVFRKIPMIVPLHYLINIETRQNSFHFFV